MKELEQYTNKKVRTLCLDLSANNVGFCVGDLFIDSNGKVVFNPDFIFQEHTKIKYSHTGYNNYDLGLTGANIYQLVKKVIKRFSIDLIVAEIPVGRRDYENYKKIVQEISKAENIDHAIEDAFYTNTIRNGDKASMEEKGSFASEIMHQDWSSTTLGLAISMIYSVSVYTPSRHPITVHPLDIKEATGEKRYHKLTKEEMVFSAITQYPELNYFRDKDGKATIDDNEHAVDALYCGKALELKKSEFKAKVAIKNTINKNPSKYKQMDGMYKEVNWSNIDSVLNKYGI